MSIFSPESARPLRSVSLTLLTSVTLGNFVPDVQRVDLAEVAVCTPVMGGEADVAVPDGGVLKMSDAFGKRLAVRTLTDPHA